MNRLRMKRNKLGKQWKNQKRALKNRVHQKMKKKAKKMPRKNSKNYMLKK